MLPDRAETLPRTSPRVILLVEDEADARTILSRRLQAFGWNCLAHASVESALHDPDLRYVEAVVADVVLGEGKLSGIELIAGLRKQDLTQVYAKLGVAGRAEFFHLVFPS